MNNESGNFRVHTVKNFEKTFIFEKDCKRMSVMGWWNYVRGGRGNFINQLYEGSKSETVLISLNDLGEHISLL